MPSATAAKREDWRVRLPCGDESHDAFKKEPALEQFARRVCSVSRTTEKVRDPKTGYEVNKAVHNHGELPDNLIERINAHIRDLWLVECGKMSRKDMLINLGKAQKQSPDSVQTYYGDESKLRKIAAVEGYWYFDEEDTKEEQEPRGSKSGKKVASLDVGLE